MSFASVMAVLSAQPWYASYALRPVRQQRTMPVPGMLMKAAI